MGDLIPFPSKRDIDIDLCRCAHFVMKHDFDTGECYGVDIDDHSIRCGCRDIDVVPEGFFDDEY